MKNPIINRHISDSEAFKVIKSDFAFLVKRIKDSGFEYDLQIRDNYFNLYYRGNSLGKLSYKKARQEYEVTIHSRFIDDRVKERFNPVEKNEYRVFAVSGTQLHALFSAQNLQSMAYKVKRVDFQEEVIYEQMLMTDNVNRNDLIIIDRQVMDKVSKTKMDLLALKRKENCDYQFCVIEVKLGNNSELRLDVLEQLKDYVGRIERHFEDYKGCYQENFVQKRELGLLDIPDDIGIIPGVLGVVVVMGYSGMAKQSIKDLKQKDPAIKVIQLNFRLDLKDLSEG
jgi:hypothetical protein